MSRFEVPGFTVNGKRVISDPKKLRLYKFIYFDYVCSFMERKALSDIDLLSVDDDGILNAIGRVINGICKERDLKREFSSYINENLSLPVERSELDNYKLVLNLFDAVFVSRCLAHDEIELLTSSDSRFAWFFYAALSCISMDSFLAWVRRGNNMALLEGFYDETGDIGMRYSDSIISAMKLNSGRLCFDSISNRSITFLDFCHFKFPREGIPVDIKREFFRVVVSFWEKAKKDVGMIRWIDNHGEDLAWAADYILDAWHGSELPGWIGDDYKSNAKEFLITSYDLLAFNTNKKRLSMSRLSRACSQRKYRDGMEGKVQCTFLLRQEIKDKLNKMSGCDGKKIYEFLEDLIDGEFIRRGEGSD